MTSQCNTLTTSPSHAQRNAPVCAEAAAAAGSETKHNVIATPDRHAEPEPDAAAG
jgi:hypothetical protein